MTQPYPVILVHGGTLQGTEWLDTPDGRPGWAQRLVEAGYAVVVIAAPDMAVAHPRRHHRPHGAALLLRGRPVRLLPPETAEAQTQWPFDQADDDAWDAFIAPFGPLPADLSASQEMDADRLARLVDRIGPAIVMTHSASGPVGWLLADRRPGHVAALVSVEPMGRPSPRPTASERSIGA